MRHVEDSFFPITTMIQKWLSELRRGVILEVLFVYLWSLVTPFIGLFGREISFDHRASKFFHTSSRFLDFADLRSPFAQRSASNIGHLSSGSPFMFSCGTRSPTIFYMPAAPFQLAIHTSSLTPCCGRFLVEVHHSRYTGYETTEKEYFSDDIDGK